MFPMQPVSNEVALLILEGVHKFKVEAHGMHWKLGCESGQFEVLFRGRPVPKDVGGMVHSLVGCLVHSHLCCMLLIQTCIEPNSSR